MWLTDVSIRRPVFITMIVLALIVMGLFARSKMPAELDPKVDFPFISIVTVYPGAGPEEMETLVTKPIEEAVGSTANLKNITSSSQDGVSAVFMEFEIGTPVDVAAADVRDKLSAARGSIPDDAKDPVVTKADITAEPIMTLALRPGNSGLSARDMRILADKTIKDRLAKTGGVASVSVSGGQEREVRVAIDRDRLQAYGLSIDRVASAMSAENMNLPSGSVKEGSDGRQLREFPVRTVGEYKNAEEIANTRLTIEGKNGRPGGTIRLGDIANVTDTVVDATVLSRLNGKDSVVFAIQKQSDANTVSVADGLKKELDLLNGYTKFDRGQKKVVKGALPAGVSLLVTKDDSTFVRDSLSDVNRSLIEGIILVILIVFLFLHSARATLIVAMAIPTSLFATYLPIWAFGFTVNFMTMLALTLCVGILVDDSIVVLENIERHVRKGEKPMDAALTGRSEIGLAAVTITLVDVVVFVPIAFMGGIVGQFFRQFGITIAIATLFSLFISFTLTPMLASRLLKTKEQEDADEIAEKRGFSGFIGRIFAGVEKFFGAIDHSYRGVLAWALQNRALVIVIGIVSLVTVIGMLAPLGKGRMLPLIISIVLPLLTIIWNKKGTAVAFGFVALTTLLLLFVKFPLGGEFIPTVDRGEFAASIELPSGSGLDATDRVTRQVEAILATVPGLVYYETTVGSTSSGSILGGGSSGAQYAKISVKLKDKGPERPTPVEDVIAQVTQKTALIPGATIRIATASGPGGSGQPIQEEITGQNMTDLIRVSDAVEAKLKTVPGVTDVKNSWDAGRPELRIIPDRDKIADLGMNVGQIASAVRTSIEGNNTSKLRDAGEEYDIRVQLDKLNRNDIQDVSNIIVGQNHDSPVYLRDVATVELGTAPNKIDRKNRQRLISVGANTAAGYSLGNVQSDIDKAVATIPTGSVAINVGGTSQMSNESNAYMMSALLLAVMLVYMLMGALFESFLTPLVIMVSLPQAMIGALLALMLSGKTFSIISMIGIIMLVGLVTKNAILLVDYTNTLRSRGKKRDEAILEAGPTRLRPILMTTLAMVGGMAPTAFALSKGSEQRQPMAIAVIGGLLLSTLLTLLVIPTFYAILDDWVNGFKRLLGLQPRKDDEHSDQMGGNGNGHGSSPSGDGHIPQPQLDIREPAAE